MSYIPDPVWLDAARLCGLAVDATACRRHTTEVEHTSHEPRRQLLVDGKWRDIQSWFMTIVLDDGPRPLFAERNTP